MDFFRKEKREFIDKPEENKNELEFNFNSFNQPSIKSDLYALVQLIHNLMFIVPGTYPDTPNMGINIKQYQFEYMSEKDIRKIEQHIMDQIETYIPTNQIVQLVARMHTDPVTQVKSLGIGFAVATDPSNVQNVFMFFSNNNGNVVSNIVY
jgi:hypothetical protein